MKSQTKHSKLKKRRTRSSENSAANRNLRQYPVSLTKNANCMEDGAYVDSRFLSDPVDIHNGGGDTEMLMNPSNMATTSRSSDTPSHDGASSSSS